MKYPPTEHRTKKGIPITVREAQINDAAPLMQCMQSYLQSGNIPLTNEEFQRTIEAQQQWIRNFIENENDLLLIAEAGQQIIGNIDLTTNKRTMMKHTGYIGMGIHQDWQNQGVGSIFMKELINYSIHNPTLEVLWLQVFDTNEAGKKLYQKMGFEVTGYQKRFFKNADGSYIDNVIMTLNL